MSHPQIEIQKAMSFSPLVSIVIPVYNGANYMREAIDSALAQSYDNCEVLVVNDGSSDKGETERIALGYGDRIRYFSKGNGGVASALNLGIREMRGEYFSWLSHDDIYLPHKISAQIAFMGRFELHGAVLYSDYELIDAAGNVTGAYDSPDVAPEEMFRFLYNAKSIHGCTLLIPKQALLEAGCFPEEFPTTQDSELWFRLCRMRSFVLQKERLIQVRLHEGQGCRTLPSHRRELRAFYFRHLPGLLVYGGESLALPDAAKRESFLLTEALGYRMEEGDIGPVWDTFMLALVRTKGLASKVALLQRLGRFLAWSGLRRVYLKLPTSLRQRLAPFKAKNVPEKIRGEHI